MEFLRDLFAQPPCPPEKRPEVDNLVAELIQIGKRDDYLSERHLPGFNSQYRHIRARQIGSRLNEIGGLPMMEYAFRQVRRKAGKVLASHLEYAWAEIGKWMR